MARRKLKRKVKRKMPRRRAHEIKISVPRCISITRNDLAVMAFFFLFLSFSSPPYYPILGFVGTYFVLLVYMFHSVVLVLALRYIWDNFLNDFFKVRQLHLDGKQKRLR